MTRHMLDLVGPRSLALVALLAPAACAEEASISSAPMEMTRVDPTPDTCVTPWGIDLCALFGVREAFPFDGDQLSRGERWTPVQIWITNAAGGLPGLPITYRDGYTPAFADPMADFLSKLDRVTVVIDGDTARERVVAFEDAGAVTNVVRTEEFLADLKPEEMADAPLAAVMPRMDPLAPGGHTAWMFWELSAEHCDGLPATEGEPLEWHCLPGEELFIREVQFEVARH